MVGIELGEPEFIILLLKPPMIILSSGNIKEKWIKIFLWLFVVLPVKHFQLH
jgi:hypothetical protein